jgi:hypothetical protein
LIFPFYLTLFVKSNLYFFCPYRPFFSLNSSNISLCHLTSIFRNIVPRWCPLFSSPPFVILLSRPKFATLQSQAANNKNLRRYEFIVDVNSTCTWFERVVSRLEAAAAITRTENTYLHVRKYSRDEYRSFSAEHPARRMILRYMILPPPSPRKVRIERRSNCNRVLTQSRKNWDRRRFARSRIAATTAAAILFPSAFAPPVIQPRYLHGWLFFVIWAGGGGGGGETAHYHAWHYRLWFCSFSQNASLAFLFIISYFIPPVCLASFFIMRRAILHVTLSISKIGKTGKRDVYLDVRAREDTLAYC